MLIVVQISEIYCTYVKKIGLPLGEGMEDAVSDVLLMNRLTRIKQIYTSTKMITTSKAAVAPPTMAANVCFLGFLSPACKGVSVGTPFSPSTEAVATLLSCLDLEGFS